MLSNIAQSSIRNRKSNNGIKQRNINSIKPDMYCFCSMKAHHLLRHDELQFGTIQS